MLSYITLFLCFFSSYQFFCLVVWVGIWGGQSARWYRFKTEK